MFTQQKQSLSYPETDSNPLILEEWDGKIYHRKGYREVLSGAKTVEQIMGSNSLQAEIISYILQIVLRSIDLRKYRVHMSEPGIHLSKQVNMSGDILVYDKAILTSEKISRKYADVTPKIVIEVDVNIEAEGITEMGYVFQKSGRLLEFGCEKVIWVLTEIQKVVVFTPGEEANILNWHSNVSLLENITFNIGDYLEAEGINI